MKIFSINAISQPSKKQEDREAIKKMCGCYEVTFNFAETFNYSNDSLYKPSKTKVDKGLEWAQLVTDEDDKIQIQHLLQVGNPADPHIVKHWRQDWLFENTDLYTYNADNEWTFKRMPASEVEGQWTQKVYQVDDSPRYSGIATWIHKDGRDYWENYTDSPLPRREYSKRDDYNVMRRGNHVEITPGGWVHEQDNTKLILSGAEPTALVREIGVNTYRHSDEFDPTPAIEYWEATADYWAFIRDQWARIADENDVFAVTLKGETEDMYLPLLELADQIQAGDITLADAKPKALETFREYVTGNVEPLQARLRPTETLLAKAD